MKYTDFESQYMVRRYQQLLINAIDRVYKFAIRKCYHKFIMN